MTPAVYRSHVYTAPCPHEYAHRAQDKKYNDVVVTAFPGLVTASSPVCAVGFDCSKVPRADEKTIYVKMSLSEKDIQMTTTYNLLRELLLMGTRGHYRMNKRSDW